MKDFYPSLKSSPRLLHVSLPVVQQKKGSLRDGGESQVVLKTDSKFLSPNSKLNAYVPVHSLMGAIGQWSSPLANGLGHPPIRALPAGLGNWPMA
jgi:hypothetical protein